MQLIYYAVSLSILTIACTSKPTAAPADTNTDTELPGYTTDTDTDTWSVVIEEAVVTFGGHFISGSHGLAMRDDGVLFIADTYGNLGQGSRLYTVAPPYTDYPEQTDLTGEQLTGMAWADGILYLCDLAANTVSAYDETLQLVETWSATYPWNIHLGPDGSLYTTSAYNSVEKLNDGSPPTTVFGDLEYPYDGVLDASGDGLIWVSEQISTAADGRVALYDAEGLIVREISYPWVNPEGLGVDALGYLWVAETGASRLLRYDPATGELLEEHEIPGLPIGITHDPSSGDLIVGMTQSATSGKAPSWWRVTVR